MNDAAHTMGKTTGAPKTDHLVKSHFKKGLLKKGLLLAGLAAALIEGAMTPAAAFAKELRVASNTTFPPFEFVDNKTGETTGFEMDLIREMGEKAGYDVVIRNLGFDAIIPAILTHSVDVGASGFSVTPERAKRVLFTTPFYNSGLTVLVRRDGAPIKSVDDLRGRRIAVQIGTTAAARAKAIEGAVVTTFNHAGEAILDLENGGVDAVINDKPVTDYILARQPRLKDHLKVLPGKLTSDDFAMVVARDNPALKAELDAALEAMKASGEYDRLHAKWFGEGAAH